MEDDKPVFILAGGRKLTFENAMNLFRQMTGREPTPEELADAKKAWEKPGDGLKAAPGVIANVGDHLGASVGVHRRGPRPQATERRVCHSLFEGEYQVCYPDILAARRPIWLRRSHPTSKCI